MTIAKRQDECGCNPPLLTIDEDLAIRCTCCTLKAPQDLPDAPVSERLAYRVRWNRKLARVEQLKRTKERAHVSQEIQEAMR